MVTLAQHPQFFYFFVVGQQTCETGLLASGRAE